MSGLRPELSPLHLLRPRLLNLLPDDGGHVVHIEAPYGYGKSVLATQYANQLEQDDWRVVWGIAQQTNHDALCLALAISSETPWPLLLKTLWEQETLVVLEDAKDEDLGFLLENPQGIVVLLSRHGIQHAELLKLQTQGRFTHLDASMLALTLEESQALIVEPKKSKEIWELTAGWALPIHFSALTGQAPDAASLLTGIKESLTAEAWQELLFLAALEYLPEASSNDLSLSLVKKGFVQKLESSFKVHDYVSEMIFERFSDQVSEAVLLNAKRLPLVLQGDAFARCALFNELLKVLEATDAELWRQAPQQLLTWHCLLGATESANRFWAVAAAHGRLGNVASSVEFFDLALAQENLSAGQKLGIMRDFCMPLGFHDNERGLALLEEGQTLVKDVDAELAARFLSNSAFIYIYNQDFDKALEIVQTALDSYPKNSSHRLGAIINQALLAWDLNGNFELRLKIQLETYEQCKALYPVQALGQCRDLAFFHWWLGDIESAKKYFKEAKEGERINPAIACEAKAALAFFNNDGDLLTHYCYEAKAFPNPYVSDIVTMYKLRLELEAGNFEAAKHFFEESTQGELSRSVYALMLDKQDLKEEALALIDEVYETAERTLKLFLMSSRYLISKDEADLNQFLDICTARTKLLAAFIPLSALPQTPELSKHYPIKEVLASNWTEAISYRFNDIPKLELFFFTKLEAHLFNEPLELTDRQKQILCLLTMGLSRDEVAEAMWPNVDTKKQRNNLNVQLNFLRKVIEPWGISSYLFEEGLQRVNSDYEQLTTALTENNADLVLELYHEPFAPGLHLDAIIDEREQLREQVINCLFEASEATEKSTDYLNRVLELEPLHEEALQAVLGDLISRGRKREARQRYRKFAKHLKDDMGLEPAEETQALLEL